MTRARAVFTRVSGQPPPSAEASAKARPLRARVATHPDGPSITAWLDDAEWAPWLTKVRDGFFGGALLELPALSFAAAGPRSAERPMGRAGLRGPDKEMVRTETVLARRAATVAGILQAADSPWIVWVVDSSTDTTSPEVDPWDTLSWNPLRPALSRWSGVTATGERWRAAGSLPDAAGWLRAWEGQSPGSLAAAEALSAQRRRGVLWEAGVAAAAAKAAARGPSPRLVRSSPHTMRLEGPEGEPGEAAPVPSAADDPNRAASTKEAREAANRRCAKKASRRREKGTWGRRGTSDTRRQTHAWSCARRGIAQRRG